MRVYPLASRIKPAFMLAPDDGSGGGGGGGATEATPSLGGAFSGLAASLKKIPDGESGEVEEPKNPPKEPPAPPAPTPKKEKPATPPEPKKGAPGGLPEGIFKAEPAAHTPPAEPSAGELNRDELTKGMSDKGRANFERLESHWKEKYSRLEADFAEAKKAAPDPEWQKATDQLKAEHEKLKAEHAEMLKTVELIGVERSPVFQQKYVAGRAKMLDAAAKKVLAAGGSADKFKAAMELEGRARYDAIEEALNDAPAFVGNQVAQMVSQIDALDEERAEAIGNAKGKLTEWGEEEQKRSVEEGKKLAAARESRFAEILPSLAKDVIFLRRLPDATEGGEEWNKVVDEVATGAKEFLFTASNFDDFAAAAVKSKAYDRLQPLFLSLREENISLAKQVADLSEAEPGGGAGSGAGGGGGGSGSGGEPLSFAERVKRGMDMSGQAA